jgi:hypothetical protein
LVYDRPIVMQKIHEFISIELNPSDTGPDLNSPLTPALESIQSVAFQQIKPKLNQNVLELVTIVDPLNRKLNIDAMTLAPYLDEVKRSKIMAQGTSWTSSYVNHYPDDDTEHTSNVDFYAGRIPAPTHGGYIDEILKNWFGNYDLLEERHNYIQFLFPIRETGMSSVPPLSKNESIEFQKSKELQAKLVQSFQLMLDFYGMQYVDGVFGRSKEYKECYDNLNTSSHNYLRITRVLKCLGMCGLENLKKPWLKFLITEVFKNKVLTNTTSSLIRYWIPTLRNESDLEEVENYVKELTGKRVTRKWYDKEERTWANVSFPIKKDEEEGKFYHRDDNDDLSSTDLVDIAERRYYSSWNNPRVDTDNEVTPTESGTPLEFYQEFAWDDSEDDEHDEIYADDVDDNIDNETLSE